MTNVLDSLVILVILACCIGPSRKIAGADDLIEVFHHLVGEFGGEEGDCYVMVGRSVFDVNGAVVGPLTRAGLRRATKGVCRGDNR